MRRGIIYPEVQRMNDDDVKIYVPSGGVRQDIPDDAGAEVRIFQPS